jgi:hypothetical protein
MALPSPNWSLNSGERYSWMSDLADTFADTMERKRQEEEERQTAEAYADYLGAPSDGSEPEEEGGLLSNVFGGVRNLFGTGSEPGPFEDYGDTPEGLATPEPLDDPGDALGDIDGYISATRTAESGGNDYARNPRSSAAGRYQFTDDTWNRIADRDPNDSITREGRFDGDQQDAAMQIFTRENANALMGAGIRPDRGSLYAAHFLGPAGASNVLTRPDDTPIASLVSDGVVRANPFLADMSVGEFRQWAAEKGGGSAQPSPSAGGIQMAGGGMPSRETVLRMGKTAEGRRLLNEMIRQRYETQNRDSFETFEDEDGNTWQRNTRTGEQDLVREAPNRYRTFEEGGAVYQEDSFGKRDLLRDPDDSRLKGDIITLEMPDGSKRSVREDDPGVDAALAAGARVFEKPELSSTETTELFEADDVVEAGIGAVSVIDEALELNDQAFSGFAASGRAAIGSHIPFGNDNAIATQNLENLILGQGLAQLKTTFGAAPTEGERQVLMQLQGSINMHPETRKLIWERAKVFAQRRIEFNRAKAQGLRTGTYTDPDGNPEMAAPAAAPVAAPRPRARNKQTGEVLEFDGTQWVPVPGAAP